VVFREHDKGGEVLIEPGDQDTTKRKGTGGKGGGRHRESVEEKGQGLTSSSSKIVPLKQGTNLGHQRPGRRTRQRRKGERISHLWPIEQGKSSRTGGKRKEF